MSEDSKMTFSLNIEEHFKILFNLLFSFHQITPTIQSRHLGVNLYPLINNPECTLKPFKNQACKVFHLISLEYFLHTIPFICLAMHKANKYDPHDVIISVQDNHKLTARWQL